MSAKDELDPNIENKNSENKPKASDKNEEKSKQNINSFQLGHI